MNITAENIGIERNKGNEIFEKNQKSRFLRLALGILIMFSIGICYAWSIFNAPIAKEYPDWTKSSFSMIFTAFMISYSVFGILSGYIIRKRKGKANLNFIISAVLLFFSFFISSRATTLAALFIGFGIMGGAGVVFAYNSVVSVLSLWFRDLLGVATGFLLMGYGLGSFIIGKIYSAIIQGGGEWRTVFLFFGIFLTCLILIASFVIVPPPEGYVCPTPRKPKIDKHPIEPLECTPAQMMKRKSFWLLFGMGTFITMASMGVTSNARLLVQAVAADMPLTDIATIAGLISIFNALGRIFTGFLNDWGGLRCNIIISDTAVTVSTVLVAFAVLSGNIVFLVISFILFGFSAGMSVPDGAVVTQKLFGSKNFQINMQVVMFCGVFNSFGAMILSGIAEACGNYVLPLFVLAGIAFIGWLCALFLKKP